jgi:hypothetical protein
LQSCKNWKNSHSAWWSHSTTKGPLTFEHTLYIINIIIIFGQQYQILSRSFSSFILYESNSYSLSLSLLFSLFPALLCKVTFWYCCSICTSSGPHVGNWRWWTCTCIWFSLFHV